MRKSILFALCIMLGHYVLAQSTISGKVTSNEDGYSLPGVTVLIKGTTGGAVTDVNGNYVLKLVGENPILLFNYVGYLTQEIEVGNQDIINVELEVNVETLEEVVITGYGVQKKKVVVGAISQISAET